MVDPKVVLLLIVISCFCVNYVVPKSHRSFKFFAADVYKEVVKTKRGNFVVCPISAELIVGLAFMGANGKTAEELGIAMGLLSGVLSKHQTITDIFGIPIRTIVVDTVKKRTQTIFTKLSPIFHGDKDYYLSAANKIYVKDGFHITEFFKLVAGLFAGTDVQSIDFKKKQEAVKEINDWVEKKTHEKIKNLVAEKDIDPSSMLVLINTMFFEANWVNQFDKKLTQKEEFYKNNNEKVKVDFMKNTAFFEYYECSKVNAKFLQARYKGKDVSMTFVLPNEKEGLAKLEKDISKILIADPKYELKKVHVEIPKFTVESSIDFNDILKNLGVHEAFGNSANFEDILEEKVPLKISKVLQKTFVEVTESGTTAATATEAVFDVGSSLISPPIMEFVADHPFIFYIKIKGVVFFVGRYNSP